MELMHLPPMLKGVCLHVGILSVVASGRTDADLIQA
jgi:hypothetical protein